MFESKNCTLARVNFQYYPKMLISRIRMVWGGIRYASIAMACICGIVVKAAREQLSNSNNKNNNNPAKKWGGTYASCREMSCAAIGKSALCLTRSDARAHVGCVVHIRAVYAAAATHTHRTPESGRCICLVPRLLCCEI